MLANTGVSFLRPWALLLLLVLVPSAIYFSRTSMALLRRGRRRFSLGLRIAIITLLVLALAGTEIVRAADSLSVVFLLDRSDSVGTEAKAQQLQYVRDALKRMGDSDAAGVVAFGSDSLVDRPVSGDRTLAELTSAPQTTFTNLADALRLGLASAPADTERRLVLISDGKENAGNAEQAALLAAASGVPVDVVPLAAPSGPEVWVEGLTAPAAVRENERTSLQIAVQSSVDTTTTLALLVDNALISRAEVRLVKGANNYVQSLPALPRGIHAFGVQVIPPAGADTRTENNRYSAYSVVLGKPKVLIVQKAAGEGEVLRAALGSSIDADLVLPGQIPADVKSLAGYEGIVLVNVPATTLSAAGMEALQSYVRDLGKGLVVVGGDESYAAGGYFRTPLEAMLPVDLNLPSKLDIPAVAMVLVVDRSGSMGEGHTFNGAGVTKLELAKEAAYRAVAQLSTKDYLGVISFDSAADWVVSLQPLGDPSQFKGRIGGISLGGGTNIYSGLAPAVDALVGSKARSKHIVLLTDGQSEGGDYEGLLKRMHESAITISTVAVGTDADTNFLKNLATAGGGRYYYTEEGNALPEIFAHESHLAARSYLVEHDFTPARTSPSPLLDGLGGLPALHGYVGTSPKPAGQVVLVSDAGDPVLAQWQYGLGRVIAWTSDAKGQWAREWVGWQGFPQFWAQAVRWTIGTEAGGSLQTKVDLEAGTAHVTVDAVGPEGSYMNDLQAQAAVVGPALTSTVVLRQTSAGRYEGNFAATEEGVYVLHVSTSGSGTASTGQTIGVVVPYSPEYRGGEDGSGLLARIASASGGRVLGMSAPDAAFEHNLEPVKSSTPAWPLLLVLALLLLPFDVGVRRVSIYRGDVVRAWGSVKARVGRVGRGQPAVAATPDMAALLGAKQRGEERVQRPPIVSGRVSREKSPGRATGPLVSAPPTVPNNEAQELHLTGLEGRTTRHEATPPSLIQPRAPEEPDDSGSLAARLRKSREQRR